MPGKSNQQEEKPRVFLSPKQTQEVVMDSPMPDLTGNESTGHKRTRSRHSRTSSTLGGSDVLGMVAGTGSIRAVEPMWKGWQVDDQQSGLEMPLFGSVPGGPGAGKEELTRTFPIHVPEKMRQTPRLRNKAVSEDSYLVSRDDLQQHPRLYHQTSRFQ
ncbi:hypothetical protein QFC20_004260 [Naganishia adeliensis]|uniref:Uncharacterized protein n=1 Tax=Naganishia adeliensis TaxID=92952 RepID=A0ACC2W249_9TREE|nr:hypothetical protein QFC20_004260 [Naganishia adeliensis]